ncbi:MAG: CBS domain-containing protein [Candidatus Saliniplasma sp.]
MARVEDFQAKDVMTKNFITAKSDDKVSDAIGIMRNKGVAEIPILEDGDIVGIVAEDMFVKKRHLPFSTKLAHVMTKPPNVKVDDNLIEVSEMLLSSGYRGVPVQAKNKESVGFVSRTDIIKKIPEIDDLKKSTVGEYMTPNPTTIKEHDSINKAKNMMENLDEKVIPVTDEHGRLSGMVGIKDIIKDSSRPVSRHERGEKSGEKDSPYQDMEIRSLMVTPPITTTPDESLHDGAEKMTKNNISTLVAVKGEDIKGILTQIDLIETIASFRESDQVYVQITGLEEDPDVYDQMYQMVQKYLQKINKVLKPLVLNLHVVTHQTSGHEKKYSIRLRLNTDHGMFYAKKFDWNIMRALDDGMNSVQKKIFKEKEKKLDRYRKHPKYRASK